MFLTHRWAARAPLERALSNTLSLVHRDWAADAPHPMFEDPQPDQKPKAEATTLTNPRTTFRFFFVAASQEKSPAKLGEAGEHLLLVRARLFLF
jgi:hypothetical protein